MNSKDAPIGVGLLVLAVLILWHVSSFPPAPGQPYNAALFPAIAAVGLALAAVGLILSGIRQRQADRRAADDLAAAAAAEELARVTGSGNDMEVLETTKVPSRLLAILFTAGSVVFYLVAANFLGFVVTGSILLAALMWAFGVKPAWIVPIAVVATLLIHSAFYKLLSVPLPWGLLQPIAW